MELVVTVRVGLALRVGVALGLGVDVGAVNGGQASTWCTTWQPGAQKNRSPEALKAKLNPEALPDSEAGPPWPFGTGPDPVR